MPDLTSGAPVLAVTALLAYLLGSVSFGLVMARLFGLGDLRSIGSGSIGATNVLRTGNRLAAFLTLVLDAGKGGIAVVLARWLTGAEDAAQLAGAAALFGHCYPVWLGFRGGKGVATFFGTLLVISWPVFIAAGATWLAVAAVTRYSSAGGLAASASAPLWALALGRPHLLLLTLAFAALIWWRHRGNIARLRAGTETRIGRKTG